MNQNTLERVTAYIEDAHALAKSGQHEAAVALFVATRELVCCGVDQTALDREIRFLT